ncbi:MAG: ATP-binding cassette domain-containing protein [Clostridia bacterium]|nr:ATP-binding cassette domain-containing protein [Clostridia bacterium]
MLKLNNIYKKFNKNMADEKIIFEDFNLDIKKGEFVVIIGGNGAGKSTLMNLISGSILPDKGEIFIDSQNVTYLQEHQRAKFIGRVFQDPLKGSAPNLTIEENLSLALLRDKKRGLLFGISQNNREFFKNELKKLDLGIENRLESKMGVLSGGQRQAVTLLMACLVKPKILLLDEHTAALDPKSSVKILELTEKIISEHHITALMITHNLNNAKKFGSRVIMLENGKIKLDTSKDKIDFDSI